MIKFNSVEFAYTSKQRTLTNINLEIKKGKNFGIVGESGSGKSTLMKLALGLYQPHSGSIYYEGAELNVKNREVIRGFRSSVQAVFQDPYSSLDPKQRIFSILEEPLVSLGLSKGRNHEWIREQVATVLASVGLENDSSSRFPREFSGGQRQRIAIARALISRPKLLLADEPVSSLDVTNREMILELLKKLQGEYGLTIAVVSHDLSVIAALCEETIVLERGLIVEAGSTLQVLGTPRHPYTQKLLRAVPRLPATRGGRE